jgi:hypothetical protein
MSKLISSGEIASIPPGVKLTTLENGLVIIMGDGRQHP